MLIEKIVLEKSYKAHDPTASPEALLWSRSLKAAEVYRRAGQHFSLSASCRQSMRCRRNEHPIFCRQAQRSASAERDIELHHDHEADHERHSGYIRAAALGLGDKLLGDDEDHGPRRKGQSVGQNWCGQDHGRRPDSYGCPRPPTSSYRDAGAGAAGPRDAKRFHRPETRRPAAPTPVTPRPPKALSLAREATRSSPRS